MGEVVSMVGGKRNWREVPFTERLLELYGRVSYMEKQGKNKHFHYKFLQESQLKDRVNLACRDLGLVILELKVEPIVQQGQGCKPMTQECVVRVTVTLANAWAEADGKRLEAITLQGLGGGVDSGDKAPMKAEVAGLKYALMNGLMVATGDEPEQSTGDDERAEQLLADLTSCESVAVLQGLKVRVAGFKGGVAYDALKEAYREAAKRLTPATA